MADVRFFTMSDADNFLGLVAMVQSLRLHGHYEPVTVLDLGLSPVQRDALTTRNAEAVQLQQTEGRHPFLCGAFPFLLKPQGTVVCIDADVIVTRPLDAVFEAATRGMVCAAPDYLANRWFRDWESLFDLSQPLRRQVYVNTGLLAFSTTHFPDLLERWWEGCVRLLDYDLPLPQRHPVSFPDQDALNALLMSDIARDRLWLFPERSAVQGKIRLPHATVVDRRRLECRYEGTPTALLHSTGLPKPWQPAARRELRRTAYLVCLRELLTTPGTLRAPMQAQVPVWLRPGALNAVAMHALCAASSIRRGHARARKAGSRIKKRALALADAVRQLPV
jgi:hypothetical protein